MGPIERELWRGADICNGGSGVLGTPYLAWPGIAAWSLRGDAQAFFSACSERFGENGVDAWSEALEAAEALGL